jgi:hypothetical protein
MRWARNKIIKMNGNEYLYLNHIWLTISWSKQADAKIFSVELLAKFGIVLFKLILAYTREPEPLVANTILSKVSPQRSKIKISLLLRKRMHIELFILVLPDLANFKKNANNKQSSCTTG